MDYYKCEKCGIIFDEFELNFNFAQIEGKCFCERCEKEYLNRKDEVRWKMDKEILYLLDEAREAINFLEYSPQTDALDKIERAVRLIMEKGNFVNH